MQLMQQHQSASLDPGYVHGAVGQHVGLLYVDMTPEGKRRFEGWGLRDLRVGTKIDKRIRL